ncbi:MAG: hypothetical protein ACK2UC_10005 [Anaerolineae bacterium]
MSINKPATPAPGEKRILVVSDYESLGRAIEINLAILPGVNVLRLHAGDSGVLRAQGNAGEDWGEIWKVAQDAHLLIVAKGSLWDEPLVSMARIGLLECVGRLPLLIISDGPYRPVPEIQISYMSFPFEVEDLQRTVLELLGMPSVGPGASSGRQVAAPNWW